jgi:DNA primase
MTPNSNGITMTLCVFHQERTPSLRIWPSGSFRCYGCGKHGHSRDEPLLRGPFDRKVNEARETAGQLRLPGVL